LKIGPNFFLQHFKNKIIYIFVKFVATKKGMTTNLFSPLSFVPAFGSGIRDPGSGMGKIRIRDKHPGSATLLIPDIQICLVFRYVAVLERDGDSVGMEDLDSLQLELESLLSSVVVRATVGFLSELLINGLFFL
jgi:hypothetical protein